MRKPHERPSIGVLLCATADDEVVEYALARTTSPTLVAEYQTLLPAKALLRKKLHELFAQLAPEEWDVQNRHAARADVLEHTAAPSKRHKRTREPGGRRR